MLTVRTPPPYSDRGASWSRQFLSPGDHRTLDVDLDSAGHVALVPRENFVGGFVAEFGPTGDEVWSVAGNASIENASAISFGSGAVVITGQASPGTDLGGGSLDPPGLAGGFFVAQYERSGVHLQSRGYGGTSGETIIVSRSGHWVVAGGYQQPMFFDGRTVAEGTGGVFVMSVAEAAP